MNIFLLVFCLFLKTHLECSLNACSLSIFIRFIFMQCDVIIKESTCVYGTFIVGVISVYNKCLNGKNYSVNITKPFLCNFKCWCRNIRFGW